MYGSSPFRSTLNTGYITALDMCDVCTEAVHSIALWTRVTLQLWACVKYVLVQAVHSVELWTRVYSFGHVLCMYRSSPFRSTLNTGYITALDMCEVWTEAVDSVALWTRVYITALDMCESMYRSNPFRSTLSTGYITALDMCVSVFPTSATLPQFCLQAAPSTPFRCLATSIDFIDVLRRR